jgi:hypothetical protein
MTPAQVADIVEVARLSCVEIYDPNSTAFRQVWNIGGVVFGFATADGIGRFIFRGTDDVRDVLIDAEALPVSHGALGVIHEGGWQGMAVAFDEARQYFGPRNQLGGHSLGGMHASIFAGLCATYGVPVELLSVYESPRAGYSTLRDLVAGHCGQVFGTKNGRDPVPHLPLTLPGQPWVDVAQYVELNEAPASECLDLLGQDYHTGTLIYAGVQKWAAAALLALAANPASSVGQIGTEVPTGATLA